MVCALHIVALFATVLAAESSAVPNEVDAQPSTPNIIWVSVPAGEHQTVATPVFDEMVVVDDAVAQVRKTPTGLEVTGTRTGKTQVQLYQHGVMNIVLVSVTSPVSKPAEDSGIPSISSFGTRGPLRTFFGANSLTTELDANSQIGWWNTTTLHGSGILRQGEYNSDVQATTGALGQRLVRAQMSWIAKNHRDGFNLGDTSLFVSGSHIFSAMQVLGLQMTFGSQSVRKYVFLGNLSTAGSTAAAQPLVGFGIDGQLKLRKFPGVTVFHGTSVLGFDDAATHLASGRVGLLVGERIGVNLPAGFGLELRGTAMASSEKKEGSTTQAGGEIGLTASYLKSDRRTAYLIYDGNIGSFYNPSIHMVAPPTHRANLAYSEHFSQHSFLSASIGYAAVFGLTGITHGYSVDLSFQRRLDEKTIMTIKGTQQASQLTGSGGRGSRFQRSFGLEGQRLFSHETLGRLQMQYVENSSYTGSHRSVGVTSQMTHHSKKNWFVGASANAIGQFDSALAVDKPPLTVQANVAANGGFVMRSLEVSTGVSVQKVLTGIGANGPVGLSFNVGVQFAPTIAHRLVANFSMTEYPGTNRSIQSASVAYSYQFGDAIHAPPVLQVFSGGDVEGTVCIDANADGRCTTGEEPISDIEVTLSDGRKTKTDYHGHYRFGSLKSGYYGVEVDEKKLRSLGRLTTPAQKGIEVAEQYHFSESFGVRSGCDIHGRVTHDLDVDGKYSNGDAYFEGAVVQASGPLGTAKAETDSFGEFVIEMPKCGTYSVEVLADKLPSSTRVVTPPIEITTSQTSTPEPLMLSISALRTISGTVFVDANHNGRKDAGEVTLEGARVSWVRNNIAGGSTVSGPEGEFLLRRLPAGPLKVVVEPDPQGKNFRPGAIELELPASATVLEGIAIPLVPQQHS